MIYRYSSNLGVGNIVDAFLSVLHCLILVGLFEILAKVSKDVRLNNKLGFTSTHTFTNVTKMT